MYERCVRVPLVMRLPGQIAAKQSTEALVEFVTGAVLFLGETDKKIKWTNDKFKDYRK